MTKQLQECINSGQVSAAQVVAHAEAGELPANTVRQEIEATLSAGRVSDFELRFTGETVRALISIHDADMRLLRKIVERVAQMKIHQAPRGFSATAWGDFIHEANAAITATQERQA